jgi:hypothetical protein
MLKLVFLPRNAIRVPFIEIDENTTTSVFVSKKRRHVNEAH